MKNRINVGAFAESMAERNGSDVDCAMMVTVADGKIAVALAGVDKHCISPDCVALASAVSEVLETNLLAANVIGRMMKESGHAAVSKSHEESIRVDKRHEDSDNEESKKDKNDHKNSDGDNIKSAAMKIIDAILDSIGGGDNDDEDDD